jgi:hypothetical protein
MNTRKQANAERREDRRRAREKLAELRRQLRDARARRKQALFDAKERCRADRLAARERARALRARVLEELRETVRAERAAARETCTARLRDARAIQDDVGRSRATLAAERQFQRDLRAGERADRERRRQAPPSTCLGCRAETDDDVLANVSSDLAALYDRVKRKIKPAAGTSRTEVFLKWAEAHPEAVLAATAHPADVAVRELEADVASTARRLNPYAERKAARIERMKARAARLEMAAEGAQASAKAVADRIPMGQPILVGHHSERRHRRDIDRIQGGFTKAAELHREAETLRRRADHVQTSSAVSSDDPDAIAKLRAKVEDLDRDRTRMVAANTAVRSKAPREALAKLGFSETMIERALTPDFAGRLGFPGYALRNVASEAARVRKRIAELEARATRPAPTPLLLPGVRVEEADNRVRIVFDAKPDDAVRSALKSAGFRWSPTVGAWQRHASNAAWYEAKRIVGEGAPRSTDVLSGRAANQNALTAGGLNPDELARLRAIDERPKSPVKGEGLDTTQIAARIRDDINEAVRSGALPKAKYSVRTDKYSMGSSITVVASNLSFEVLNPDAFVVERGANWMTFDRAHYHSRFTPEAEALEQKLNAIVDAYHWDRSDSMTDYYNERFARHVEVKENEGALKRVELAKIAAARAAEERV